MGEQHFCLLRMACDSTGSLLNYPIVCSFADCLWPLLISFRPGSMTEAPKLRAPVFGKVEGLRPDTSGHNLVVKVIAHAMHSLRVIGGAGSSQSLSSALRWGDRPCSPACRAPGQGWENWILWRGGRRGPARVGTCHLQRCRGCRSALRLPRCCGPRTGSLLLCRAPCC